MFAWLTVDIQSTLAHFRSFPFFNVNASAASRLQPGHALAHLTHTHTHTLTYCELSFSQPLHPTPTPPVSHRMPASIWHNKGKKKQVRVISSLTCYSSSGVNWTGSSFHLTNKGVVWWARMTIGLSLTHSLAHSIAHLFIVSFLLVGMLSWYVVRVCVQTVFWMAFSRPIPSGFFFFISFSRSIPPPNRFFMRTSEHNCVACAFLLSLSFDPLYPLFVNDAWTPSKQSSFCRLVTE